MSFFNFIDFSDNINAIDKKVTPNYGTLNKKEIFTLKEIPKTSVRIRMNGLLHKMLDEIAFHHNNTNMPKITQIMIHKTDCPVCKKTLPLFRRIAEELKNRLLLYNYKIIELKESMPILNKNITGYNIYKYYNMLGKGNQNVSGVPFFIQNFKTEKKKVNGKSLHLLVTLKKNEDWIVSYVGEIHPFSFISKIFNIKNLYIESSLM